MWNGVNMDKPKVTVLMPVYNSEKYLKEAIESILNQTFKDFEFLIIDDASTDKSVEIVSSYRDSRIRIIHNDRNLGCAESLNRGVKLAMGEYIARMDADDISLPNRLEKQVRFMEKNPDIGICGAWHESIGDDEGAIWQTPVKHERICVELLFLSCLSHPTVIMRREPILKNGLFYDESFTLAGDYDYWAKASKIVRLANMPEVLLKYRVYERAGNRKDIRERFTAIIIIRQLRDLLGSISEKEYALHRGLADPNIGPIKDHLEEVNNWFARMRNANGTRKIYDRQSMEWVLAQKWFQACRKLSVPELLKWGKFWKYSFSYFSAFTLPQRIMSVYRFLRVMSQDLWKNGKTHKLNKIIAENDLKKLKVTVLMPVHNGEKYLREAMESVLNQTFMDFEFVIIDDASKDNSVDIVKNYKDSRIKLFLNEQNLGISKSCAKGVRLSKGKYIARMDADDVCLPKRIEKQVDFMEKNPDIGICGAWTESIGEIEGHVWQPPVKHERICIELLFLCSLAHPTVMMRKESIYKNDLFYDETLVSGEDYELWVRAGRVVRLANIPEVLLKHREYGRVQDYLDLRKIATETIRKKQLSDLGVNFTEEEYSLHASLVNMDLVPTKAYSDKIYAWFNRLLSANKKKKIYDRQTLEWVLAHKWFLASRKLPIMELLKWGEFWQYAFSYFSVFTLPQKMKSIYLLLNMMLHDVRIFNREAVK
jgi:glycosyltransferase involved in cell wall biosynthesis